MRISCFKKLRHILFLCRKDIAGNHSIESFYHDVVHLQVIYPKLPGLYLSRTFRAVALGTILDFHTFSELKSHFQLSDKWSLGSRLRKWTILLTGPRFSKNIFAVVVIPFLQLTLLKYHLLYSERLANRIILKTINKLWFPDMIAGHRKKFEP